MVDVNQDSVRGSPKCYNGYSQLFQLKQPPHHREEEGPGVAYLSTPQYEELLIDTSPWCIPLHTALTLCERIVARLEGQKNARNTEGGTEDGIKYSDEESLQDGNGIATSSKSLLLVSQKEEIRLKAIQNT